jgi:hypothetical protein
MAVGINKAVGLNTQPNELDTPAGSLAVAENVVITRDGVIEVDRGFEDYSTNLPDFTPAQLLSIGGTAYLHLDNGLWYNSSGTWYRKRGNYGAPLTQPYYGAYAGGHLYVTTANHVIVDINLTTGARSILAGRFGSGGTSDGTGDAARFNSPYGICTDGTNLYVCDAGNNTIRKVVIATGVVTTLAGTAGAGGGTDGTGSAARFSGLRGITIVNNADLYATASGGDTVRKIVISSGVVTTFAGTHGANGDTDDVGTAARFTDLGGITTDGTNLWVVDRHAIKRIVISTASVTRIAGNTTLNDTTDGTGTDARFYITSEGAVFYSGGNLYVADTYNHTIRKIVVATAVVTTPYGTAGSSGTADGIGSAARFNNPRSVMTDGSDFYIFDYTNGLIRKLYAATGYVATLDGTPGVTAATSGLPFASGAVVGPS